MQTCTSGKRNALIQWLRRLMSILLVIFGTLAGGELYARLKGYGPNADCDITLPSGTYFSLTATHGHQPKLGYIEPEEEAASGPWIWPNYQRASRPLPVIKKPRYKVALFGCSWTFGQGAEDGDTYAWQLNEKYPCIEFDNFGVSDYGAYLACRYLRDTIARGQHYDLYIYAFIYDHIFRDLGDYLYRMEDHGTHWVFPGYELGHPYKDYRLYPTIWPGEYRLALTALLHERYAYWVMDQQCQERSTPWSELDDNRQAFRENVLAMRDMVHSAGGSFALLGMGKQVKYLYRHTLADSGIDVEFAISSHEAEPSYYNKHYDHPNARGHAKIARAVTAILQRQHLPAEVMVARKIPHSRGRLPISLPISQRTPHAAQHLTASSPSSANNSLPSR